MEPVSCQASHPTDRPTDPSELQWPRCELGTLCSLAGRAWGGEAMCGWFASWFLPSWARLLASLPLRGHIWCLPPGLGCQEPSELRPVPHFPSAYPSGWLVSLTPAALHPNTVRNFPAVNSHCTPSSPATNSKHGSLQACPPGILPEPGHCPSLPPSLLAASDLAWPQNQRMVVKSKSDLSFRGTPS